MIKADDLAKKINAKLDEAHGAAIVDGIAWAEEAITNAAEQLKFTTVVEMPCAFVAQRVAEHLVAFGYTTIRCDPDQAAVLTDEDRVKDTAGKPDVQWSWDWPALMGRTVGDYMREGSERRERTPMPTSIIISW